MYALILKNFGRTDSKNKKLDFAIPFKEMYNIFATF
jgi:hypothetical protein